MTTFTYLPARPNPRDLQPREWLGSRLAGTGFDAFGPIGDSELRDEPEEFHVVPGGQGCRRLRRPGRPDLHCMFETQLARLNARSVRGLRHEDTDQVIGKQIDP